MSKKVILIITDGIGYNKNCQFNAFCNAKKPTYDYLFKNVPYNFLKTSGLSVGLPEGQMGNSEVGHMTIGSGRIIYQNLVKINRAIEEGTLKDNEALKGILNNSKDIHIVGLLSDGGVHSHIKHIIAVAKIAEDYHKRVHLHLITDGRDVSPTSANRYIEILEKELLNENVTISTLSGRFYTMDRDKRWERVEEGYNAIIRAIPKTALSPKEYIKKSYENGVTDEFIKPTAFTQYNGVNGGDGIIFINFRNDRMREIVTAIGDREFNQFKIKRVDINIATITEYDASFNYPIFFPKETPKNTLAEVISRAGLTQFHTAETEKYAHVTFFFNGGIEEPFFNESRALIPSPKVKTYDKKPEMSAEEVGEAVLKAMDNNYNFIVVNFANGDMVGHTGVYQAGVKAVEAVDREIGKILKKAKERDYSLVLTSDHGNCEEMQKDGKVLTNHTTYDVYCFIMAKGVNRVKSGGLNNIAPTILKLMDLEIPKEMDKALI